MEPGPSDVGETLREFWRAAELSRERTRYAEFQARRYARVAAFLAPMAPLKDRRILDLGGGLGSLAVALRAALGGRYDLADVQAPSGAHRAALERFGVSRFFACDLSGRDPLSGLPIEYDLILLVEVLEHLLVNPLFLLHEVNHHLKPGGRLLVTTPNPARLSNRIRLLFGRSVKDAGRYPRSFEGVLGHVVEYGVGELDALLRAEGFRPVQVEVVQQHPRIDPGPVRRLGIRLLNHPLLRALELGDDILALYEKAETAAPRPGYL